MAIIGSIFGLLGRFAGRLLNSTLGWATVLLFGKVDGRKQTLLLAIGLGSLLWVVTITGIAFPDVGTFLLAFVPVPDFVDEGIVRLAMLGLALLIPLLIGVAAIAVAEPGSRPGGFGLVAGVLRGYPFTLVLTITIIVLAIVSVVRRIQGLAKRWENAHIPVVVKPGGYDRVLADLERVLDDAELVVEPKPAPMVLSLPPRLLDAVAGKALGGLIPDRLMILAGRELEVLVYPSDIAISGTPRAMARARGAIAAQLTDSPAYLTTSAEAERIEDSIRELAELNDGAGAIDRTRLRRRLRDLDGRILALTVPFDEWETVYRERIQVERDLLAGQLEAVDGARPSVPAPHGRAPTFEWLIGGLGLALLAADVALLLERRITGRGSG